MTPAIRIQNLSKVYKLGDRLNGDYETFRDVLVGVATAPWRAIRNRLNPDARKAHTGSLHWCCVTCRSTCGPATWSASSGGTGPASPPC